ncbi:hypothetical protein ACFWP3_38000 [Streptomyces sp. NPDC058525]|uniref:hypothetical protein n=1 Tax=Streptomyces sp. NPDC058525 TaxID=3346538 RepID=UPI003659E808
MPVKNDSHRSVTVQDTADGTHERLKRSSQTTVEGRTHTIVNSRTHGTCTLDAAQFRNLTIHDAPENKVTISGEDTSGQTKTACEAF